MSVNFFVNGKMKDENKLALCGLSAVAAGFVSGFLGSGGGAILLLALRAVYGKDGKTPYAASLCAALPTAALSAAIYTAKTGVNVAYAVRFIPFAVSGGVLGAFLMKKSAPRALDTVFALLALAGGCAALLR